MVGFNHHKADYLSNIDYIIAGGGSGFAARALLQPFDVLKIRFQLQLEPVSVSSNGGPGGGPAVRAQAKYTGMLQATKCIFTEEGVTAFWKGHVPAQYLSILFGICQFWTFEYATQRLHLHTSLMDNHPTIGNLTCGTVAGVVATTACQPFDIVRTRLVAQSQTNPYYQSMRHAFHHIQTTEGTLGLYRGWVPSVVSIAPYAGLNFGFYHLTSRLYDEVMHELTHSELKEAFHEYPSMTQSFLCGGASGLLAKAAIYPLDVIKKRLQVQGDFRDARVGFGKHGTYANLRDCILKTWQYEGMAGFFKGLSPSMVKAGLTSACYFGFYEKIIQMLALRKRNKKWRRRSKPPEDDDD